MCEQDADICAVHALINGSAPVFRISMAWSAVPISVLLYRSLDRFMSGIPDLKNADQVRINVWHSTSLKVLFFTRITDRIYAEMMRRIENDIDFIRITGRIYAEMMQRLENGIDFIRITGRIYAEMMRRIENDIDFIRITGRIYAEMMRRLENGIDQPISHPKYRRDLSRIP